MFINSEDTGVMLPNVSYSFVTYCDHIIATQSLDSFWWKKACHRTDIYINILQLWVSCFHNHQADQAVVFYLCSYILTFLYIERYNQYLIEYNPST